MENILKKLAGYISLEDVELVNEYLSDFAANNENAEQVFIDGGYQNIEVLVIKSLVQGLLDKSYKDNKDMPEKVYRELSKEIGLHGVGGEAVFQMSYNNPFLP